MKNKNYGIFAAIFGAFAITQFNFENFTFETQWKGIVFLLGFIISVVLMIVTKEKK